MLLFSQDLSFENAIRVSADQTLDPAELAGRYVYVENDGAQSGAYWITGARGVERITRCVRIRERKNTP